MNSYEELGISPGACADDIRKAHHLLSKVLHPDLQSNSEMQALALIQMSRINALVDTLLDPQRRREYDQSLRARPRLTTRWSPKASWHLPGHRRLTVVTALSLLGTVGAAVLLTLGTIWFLGGDLVHLETTTERPQLSPPREPSTRAVHPTSPSVRETASRSAPSVPRARVRVPQSDPTVAGDETSIIATVEAPPEASREIPTPGSDPTPPQPLVSPVPAPDSVPQAAASPAKIPALVGTWIYSSSLRASTHNLVRMYEPEYIQLRIEVENNTLRGEYAARYHVPDRPISSEVEFVFQGKHNDMSFPWNAADGTRGTVDLKMLGAHLLEVNWRVAVFGTRIGLGAGTAVLARRLEP